MMKLNKVKRERELAKQNNYEKIQARLNLGNHISESVLDSVITILSNIIYSGNVTVDEFFNSSFPMDKIEKDGFDLFTWACKKQVEGLFNTLIKVVDVNQTDSFGKTALFWTCANYNVPMTAALVKAGADIHHEDNEKNQALCELILGNNYKYSLIGCAKDIIIIFIEQDTDIYTKDIHGQTIVDKAKEKEIYELSEFLETQFGNHRNEKSFQL